MSGKDLHPPQVEQFAPEKVVGKGDQKRLFVLGQTAYFQVRDVSLREGTCHDWKQRSWDLKLTPPLFVKCLWFHSSRLAWCFFCFFCPPKFHPIPCFRVPQMFLGDAGGATRCWEAKVHRRDRHFWMTGFEGVFLVEKCWLTVVLL